MVFVPDLMEEKAILTKAEQIDRVCSKTYGENGVKVHISASIGICTAWKAEHTFQYLYQEADKALYRAKRQGKTQFFF